MLDGRERVSGDIYMPGWLLNKRERELTNKRPTDTSLIISYVLDKARGDIYKHVTLDLKKTFPSQPR